MAVMVNHLIVVGVGLLGGAIGFAVSASVALWWANAKGLSSMEGAHGYLGIFAGICGGLIALVFSMTLALRWQGVNGLGAVIQGVLGGGLTIVTLVVLGCGIYWLSVPKPLNRKGASPQLHFEIVPPAGVAVDPQHVEATLSCNSQERPEVFVSPELIQTDDCAAISGRAELYYRDAFKIRYRIEFWMEPQSE
jgi:hypothetical protein